MHTAFSSCGGLLVAVCLTLRPLQTHTSTHFFFVFKLRLCCTLVGTTGLCCTLVSTTKACSLDIPCSSVGKEFACSAGDPGSIPGLALSNGLLFKNFGSHAAYDQNVDMDFSTPGSPQITVSTSLLSGGEHESPRPCRLGGNY